MPYFPTANAITSLAVGIRVAPYPNNIGAEKEHTMAWLIVLAVIVVLVLVILAFMLPDIMRYRRIRSM